MYNRCISAILVALFIAINSLNSVKGQAADSLLYLLNHGLVNEDSNKFKLLCEIATRSTDADTILKYSEQAIKLAEKLNVNPARPTVLKGSVYLYAGKLASALECFVKAADYYKQDHNNIGMGIVYIYISEVYNQQENPDNAKYYLKNAIEIFRKENDSIYLASAYHDLGYVNYRIGQYDTALIIFSKTSEIYQRLGYLTEYAVCLGNSGLTYSRQSEFQKAEDYLLRAIDILTKQAEKGDERAVTEYLIEYADILQHKGEIKKAIATATESFDKASKNSLLEFERDAAFRLSKLYQISGKYDSAYHFQSIYINANDSIKSVKNIQKMADLRTEFEVAKKQVEVDVLKKNKLIQIIVIFGLVLILFLAIGLILVYYYSLKRSKRLSAALDERRILLEKQGKELKEQREELRQQKEEIISSINYAKYIQSSLLPQEEKLESLLGEHFVLYRPKDIVSGDFYWISNIENKVVVAAVDCTGHGVPGAFMSMLGTALLNEIVNKEYITHPGVILRRLRKEVINSLQQKGKRGEQKDGMDIALCTLDLENMKLQFAGANNPLYLIRKSNLEKAGTLRCELEGDDLLYEIKGDLMPIGISDKMDNFTFHEIDIFKGDTIYLFSDGFPDQFGGPDNKKFSYRKLREQLLRNNSESMADNKIILGKVLDEWKGDNSQIDDILVIGFRIG
jgi:serine phosphatase RsbU (regulator of sigma subunit)/Tfp pilus assembly protein PilF